jgi:hypothetical protein
MEEIPETSDRVCIQSSRLKWKICCNQMEESFDGGPFPSPSNSLPGLEPVPFVKCPYCHEIAIQID